MDIIFTRVTNEKGGYEEGGEEGFAVRERLGCNCGHSRRGGEPASAGGADAYDCGDCEEAGWTQTEAAERCGVTQPRMSDLVRGRVSQFSLDALVNMATKLGKRVKVDLEAA